MRMGCPIPLGDGRIGLLHFYFALRIALCMAPNYLSIGVPAHRFGNHCKTFAYESGRILGRAGGRIGGTGNKGDGFRYLSAIARWTSNDSQFQKRGTSRLSPSPPISRPISPAHSAIIAECAMYWMEA